MPKLRSFVFVGLAMLMWISCQSDTTYSVETYTVKQGDFIFSVTETGELAAVNSQTISAPSLSRRHRNLKITKLVEDGKQVEKGEVVLEFDKTELQQNMDEAKSELEMAEAELRKARASQQSKIEELESTLESSVLQHKISQLELEQASFEAEIDRKNIELDLEKAAINLEKARQEIENQKKVDIEEISKLVLKVHQAKTELEEAQKAAAMLTVKAPGPGIAIVRKSWITDEKYQVEDQVYSGWPIIGLPDLSLMQAEVQINEVDIAKIDTAQQALIKMDAFPDTSFNGRVTEVATLARNKDRDSKVKVFDIIILLAESDSTLMPGMTVSCEIIVDKVPDTLFVPLEALFKKDGENIVYVKKGGGFEPRRVEIGPENDDYVIITKGILDKDVVALTDPMQNLMKKEEEKTENNTGGEAS